jgi:hypothetical protein
VFDKMSGISWPAEELLTSQEWPSGVDTVRKLVMLLDGYEMVRFTQQW